MITDEIRTGYFQNATLMTRRMKCSNSC